MIPKKIHYCWFGENEIPEKDKKCIESWKKYCPDYEIIQWDEKNYDIKKNNYMYEAYKNKKWGFVSDYARLDVIYNYGGVYLDTDVELIKPIDELLDNKFFCGFENKDMVAFGLGYGAEKGNLIVKSIMEEYENKSFYYKTGQLNLTPCPIYQTKVLRLYGLKCNGEKQILPNKTFILPIESLCPKSYLTGQINITENTYSIHHFNMSWCLKKDIIRYEQKQNIINKYGIKAGTIICKFLDFPYRIKMKIKNVGFFDTCKFIINKIIKRNV